LMIDEYSPAKVIITTMNLQMNGLVEDAAANII